MCASDLTLNFRNQNVDLNISTTCGTFKKRQLNLPRFFPHLESSDAGTCCPHQEFRMMNHVEHPAGMLFNGICAQQAIKQNKRQRLKQSWAQSPHTGFAVTNRTHVLFGSQFLIHAKRTASELLEDSVSTCLHEIFMEGSITDTLEFCFSHSQDCFFGSGPNFTDWSLPPFGEKPWPVHPYSFSPHQLFLLTCSSSSPAHPPSPSPPSHQLPLLTNSSSSKAPDFVFPALSLF